MRHKNRNERLQSGHAEQLRSHGSSLQTQSSEIESVDEKVEQRAPDVAVVAPEITVSTGRRLINVAVQGGFLQATRFTGYHIQISNNYDSDNPEMAEWFAPPANGSPETVDGWRDIDNTDDYLKIPGSNYAFSPAPDMDGDEPREQTFSFRVRATTDTDQSDWSNVVTGTVTPIDYGDIARNAVRKAQIKPEAVDEDSLSVALNERIDKIEPIESRLDTVQAEVNELQNTPEYDENETYDEGQIVTHPEEDSLWRAIQDITSTPAPPLSDENYWEKIGDFSSLGDVVSAHSVDIQNIDSRINDTGEGKSIEAVASEFSELASVVNSEESGLQTKASNQELIDAIADEESARAEESQRITAGFTAKNGIIGHWPLSEGAGSTAHDAIAGNHGSLYGDPKWTDGPPGTSGALEFDGWRDYVEVDLLGELYDEPWTISFWADAVGKIFDNGNVIIEIISRRRLDVTLRGYTNMIYLPEEFTGWSRFTFAYDGEEANLYLNLDPFIEKTQTTVVTEGGEEITDENGNIINPEYEHWST